jgi:hypothetical protein
MEDQAGIGILSRLNESWNPHKMPIDASAKAC